MECIKAGASYESAGESVPDYDRARQKRQFVYVACGLYRNILPRMGPSCGLMASGQPLGPWVTRRCVHQLVERTQA